MSKKKKYNCGTPPLPNIVVECQPCIRHGIDPEQVPTLSSSLDRVNEELSKIGRAATLPLNKFLTSLNKRWG